MRDQGDYKSVAQISTSSLKHFKLNNQEENTRNDEQAYVASWTA